MLQKYYYILSNGTKQYVSGVTLGHVDFFQCSWGWAGKTTTTACSSVSGSDLQYVLNTVLFNKAAFSNTPAASNAAVYMIILGPTITER